MTWMTAEKWLPTSGHKQSSAAFSLEPQTKDKESLSCQICVFHCSEVHEKTVCIIHSSELRGGGGGIQGGGCFHLLEVEDETGAT